MYDEVIKMEITVKELKKMKEIMLEEGVIPVPEELVDPKGG